LNLRLWRWERDAIRLAKPDSVVVGLAFACVWDGGERVVAMMGASLVEQAVG
jgi:hypothetical protein